MSTDPPAEDELRALLAQLAADDVEGLIEEARVAARARAKAIIEESLVAEMVRAASHLEPSIEAQLAQNDTAAAQNETAAAQDEAARTQDETAPAQDETAAAQDETAPAEHKTAAAQAIAPAQSETAPAQADVGSVVPAVAPGHHVPPARKPPARPGSGAWWIYCVLRATDAVRVPAGLPGIDPGGEAVVVQDDDLAAVISWVPLSDFGDEELRGHLNDMAWVERTGNAHDALVELVLAEATLVPMRLCTLADDLEAVRRMLRDRRDAMRGVLTVVEGCAEWDVKLSADRARLTAAIAPEQPQAEPVQKSSAARRRARQRYQRVINKRVVAASAEMADSVHTQLALAAKIALTNPPDGPQQVAEDDDNVILSGAYLVLRDGERRFQHAAEAIQERCEHDGFELRLTGPSPPYNFVSTADGLAP